MSSTPHLHTPATSVTSHGEMRALLTRRVCDGGVEAAEVDEGVGAQEEVGDDGGNGVELSFRDPRERGDSLLGSSITECPEPSLSGYGNARRATGAQGVSAFSSVKGAHHFVNLKAQCFVSCKVSALWRMESNVRVDSVR